MNNSVQKTRKENNKYKGIIDDTAKKAKRKGLINLDFLDNLPDDDVNDKAIPFPYGRGHGKLNVWK